MAVLAALLVFVPCAWTMQLGEHSFLLQNTGEALALALVLAAIVVPGRPATRPAWALKVLESPAFVAVGAVSYSLFLWHYPVILWLREHGLTAGGLGGLAFNLLLVAVVAGGLSALTYCYVERPALRHKRRGRRAPEPPARNRSRPHAQSASTSRRRRLGQSAVASFRRSLPGVSPASTSMRGSASRSAPRRTVPARTVNATA